VNVARKYPGIWGKHIVFSLLDCELCTKIIFLAYSTMPEYQDKVFICNYRFKKEFTAGQHSDWTINVANHFRAIDLINESK